MSFVDSNLGIEEFLEDINLGQYIPNFKDHGYNTVPACVGINNNVLQEIGILPTGHRRRILKQIETLFSKMQEQATFLEHLTCKALEELEQSHSLHSEQDSKIFKSNSDGVARASPTSLSLPVIFSSENYVGKLKSEMLEQESLEAKHDSFSDLEFSSSSCHNSDCSGEAISIEKSAKWDVSQEMADVLPGLDSCSAGAEGSSSQPSFAFCETKSSENDTLTFTEMKKISKQLPDSPFFEFKGEMIDNDLYGICTDSCTKTVPRMTRSFVLRHRPVPKIPGSPKGTASVRAETAANISLL